MRKYYIHFEPFFDSIENGFMGIDLDFFMISRIKAICLKN